MNAYRQKTGKTSALGRYEFVTGLLGTVMSDMAWQGDMSGDPVGWIIFVILIMQGILEPPKSTVDRVLFQ